MNCSILGMPTASKSTTFKLVKRSHGEAISDRGPSHLFSVISYIAKGPYSFPHKGKLRTGGEVFDEANPV